jgi:hypothetical protein
MTLPRRVWRPYLELRDDGDGGDDLYPGRRDRDVDTGQAPDVGGLGPAATQGWAMPS